MSRVIAASRTEPGPPDRSCPFLVPVAAEETGTLPGGYRCRARGGRPAGPSGDEMAWLCTGGHHHACPTYRRRRAGAADGS